MKASVKIKDNIIELVSIEISKDSKKKIDILIMAEDLQYKVKAVNEYTISAGRDLMKKMSQITINSQLY